MPTAKKKTTNKPPLSKPPPQEKQDEPVDLNKLLRFGILAGLKADGNYTFETFGTEKTFSNLTAVEDYVSRQFQAQKDKQWTSGDALVHQVAQILLQVSGKLDRVLSLLEKPQDQLS